MGSPSDKPSSPLAGGGRFGKYLVVRELGRGGKGVVYEALDSVLDRKVALKLILADPSGDPKAAAEESERFLREARLCANLPKHPHIVSVYEAGEIEGKKYLAMELVQGRSMMGWRKQAALTLADKLRLLRDVALAMDHAHRHGLVHRDLKPQNILVDADHQPHVTDFGLAKKMGQEADSAKVAPGYVLGTPAYMSPEHARGVDGVDHRADVFSLGVMLYEAISGRAPFRGESNSEIMDRVVNQPVSPPTVRAGADPGAAALQKALEPACMKALVKNPRERLESARAFADAISQALGESRPPAAAPAKKPVALLAGIGAGVVLLGILLALVLSGGPAKKPEEELARAARLMEAGKPADALAVYNGLLASDPAHAAALDGKKIAQKRMSDQIEADKHKAASDASDKLRREMEEKQRLKDEENRKELARLRQAEEERDILRKAELAKSELEKDRLKAEKEALEKAQKETEAKAATPAPTPVATPTPAPVVPVNPFGPAPAPGPGPGPLPFPTVPTGEAKVVEGGLLQFEAEDFTGGAQPVEGEDYHDTTPQNSGDNVGRRYRNGGVDLGGLGSGAGYYVGDIAPGEWLRFRFQGGGRFQAELRYFARDPATVHFEVDGENVSGPVTLPPPAGQNSWGTALADWRAVPEGAHQVKIVFDANNRFGLDYFRLKKIVLVPPPEAALLREAEKSIRELFKADYAKKAAADLQLFSRRLREESQRAEHDAVTRFVLLSEARDVAAQGGELTAAMECIREQERVYVVDGVALRLGVLALVSKAAKTAESWKAVAEGYFGTAELASDAEDYESALAAASKAEAAARSAKESALLAEIQAREKELTALRDEHRNVKGAFKTLGEKPDDAAANLAAGIYYCFARGEWSRGLPMLAKGSDAGVAAAARAEIADPSAEGAIAEAWNDAGMKKSTGTLKTRLLTRALHWYDKALADATGAVRLKMEGQVEALSKALHGSDTLRKGLVFWIEPGRDAGEGLREYVAGVRGTNNNNVPTLDAGGRALSFGRGWIDYPATDAVKGVEKYGSIFAWIKATDYRQRGGIVNRGDAQTGMDDFGLWVAGGSVGAWFNYPNTRDLQRSKGTLTPGKWAFIGVTWDDKTIRFYIDGKEDTAVPIATMGAPQRTSAKISVGSNPPGGQDPFTGNVGSVLIYGRTLTPPEVQQLYGGTRLRFR